MVEQSFMVDWSRVPDFFTYWNKLYDVSAMNGTVGNFEIVFSSYAPDNIQDCLAGTLLNEDVVITHREDCGLEWDTNGIVSIFTDVIWNVGDEIIPLKAIFLRNKANGVVMGYSINQTSFDITNQVILDGGTVLWSFHTGGYV